MGGCIWRIHFEDWVKVWTNGADIVLIDAGKRGQMLRFEFCMRISIIQDAFSAAEWLLPVAVLNSLGCDARSEEEYSAADFRQLNRDRTIFPNTMGVLKTLYLGADKNHARSSLGTDL